VDSGAGEKAKATLRRFNLGLSAQKCAKGERHEKIFEVWINRCFTIFYSWMWEWDSTARL